MGAGGMQGVAHVSGVTELAHKAPHHMSAGILWVMFGHYDKSLDPIGQERTAEPLGAYDSATKCETVAVAG